MDFATLMDSQSGIVALGMAAVSGVCLLYTSDAADE